MVLVLLVAAFIVNRIGFKKIRTALLALTGIFAFMAGFTSAPDFVLSKLENRFPRPVIIQDPVGIIILGGGFDNDITTIRGGFEVSSAGDRVISGLELMRKYPEFPLIYTGGSAAVLTKIEPEAITAKRFFEALTGSTRNIIFESKSRNTWENAKRVAEIINNRLDNGQFRKGKWLLVTSAFHMPRSIASFTHAGVDVIPWPTDYRSEYQGSFWVTSNSTKQIIKSEIAIKEIAGLAAYYLLNRL